MPKPPKKGVEPQLIRTGDNPSNTILFDARTPETLGQLIALYEYKVFAEAVIWGINSIDQWGVERGNSLASSLTDAVSGDSEYIGSNTSTKNLPGKM
jgi:glucose-6-phosphate isomerase